MSIILTQSHRIFACSTDADTADHNSVASALLSELCDVFISHIDIIEKRILKNVENPNKLPKEFTYDADMFRDYFYDKFFSNLSEEVYYTEAWCRARVPYIIHSAIKDDSSILVSMAAHDNGEFVAPRLLNHCGRHETQFFIRIAEEEGFKYTVVQPDKSVVTFYVPKGDGSKSVTVRDKDVFVYRDEVTGEEDTIVFSRLTKTPVLNVVVKQLEETKSE